MKRSIMPLYSRAERGFQTGVHRMKAVIFAPVLGPLSALGVTAGQVSFLSGGAVILLLLLSLFLDEPWYFVVGLALHVALDALDGAVARYQNTQNLRGAFLDALCDHVGIVAAAVFILAFHPEEAVASLIFAVLYTIVTAASLALGVLNRSPSFVIRPRLFLFLAIALDEVWGMRVMPTMLLLSVAVLAGSSVTCILKLFALATPRP